MSKKEELLKNYIGGVQHPNVSGFEILELLDVRSGLAEIETELNGMEREKLEEADSVFLQNADKFYESIGEVANLLKVRREAKISPSHWWWYLEKLVKLERITVSGK